MLGAILAVSMHAGAATDTLVQPESGFDGAVTVLETGVDDDVEFATVQIPYLDMRGERKVGQGRVFLPKDAADKAPLPPFVHVHYEKDLNGARPWCRKGWAVFTAHYDPKAGAPLDISVGDSTNLARALIEWVRRLPFVDRTHLHIDGGSQGGYMALAMAAEMFPVAACTPDVPVVNWAYNLNYFEANKAVSGYPGDWKKSRLPVLCAVSELADGGMRSSPVPSSYDLFGSDLSSPSYYYVSPISYLNRIACPTLITIYTGDMLVPIAQTTRRPPTRLPEGEFPEGYTRDFESLTLVPEARKTLEDVVGEANLHVEVIPAPEGLHELKAEHVFGEAPPPPGPPHTDRPWSKDTQWSLVIHDEGPPRPWSPHSRYQWSDADDSFVAYYREATPAPSILNAAKLARLMDRYTRTPEPGLELADGTVVNRFNFEDIEKLDVVQGLLDYGGIGPEHLARLEALYATGPSKPFGPELSMEDLASLRDEVRRRPDAAINAGGS